MALILLEMAGMVVGASTTSNAVAGSGTKYFTVSDDQPFAKGMTVLLDGGGGNTMTGTVKYYNEATRRLAVDISGSAGSGTFTAWAISGLRTLYFSDGGYTTQPTDTPANQPYAAALNDPANFEQHLFGRGSTSGKSVVGKGDIRIADTGDFDFMRQMGFDGQTLTLLSVANNNTPRSDAVVLFSGTIDQVDYSDRIKSVRMRDRLSELSLPAQEAVFQGTNSGSTGLEGLAGGIKGQTKPFGYGGKIEQAEPSLLNDSTQIYGVNFDSAGNRLAVQSFDAVYDKGLALTFDQDLASAALLAADTIPAGHYSTCLAEGLFRLQTTPSGRVTCDFTVGATGAARTAAQVTKSLLVDRGGYSSGDYDDAAFSDLDTATGSVAVALYVNAGRSLLDCVTDVLSSVGAGLIVDEEGRFKPVRMIDPVGETPVAYFTEYNTIQGNAGVLERISSSDPGDGLPAKQVAVQFRKCYTVQQPGELAGGATEPQKRFSEMEYRFTLPVINPLVALKHTLAAVREYPTLLTNETDAVAMRDYWNGLTGTERDLYILRASISPLHQIGDTINIVNSRYGLSAGKNFFILGRVFGFARPYVDYYVWG